MLIAFHLSMPNKGSWNGRWSGEGRQYVRVHSIGSKAKCADILSHKSYYYNFGDGWGASIAVEEVTAQEARELKKKSAGFCGYDWMIDSIRMCGDIRPPSMNT